MRIVITGANGQLGVALSQVLAGRAEVIGRDLPAFDITAADCAAQVAALSARLGRPRRCRHRCGRVREAIRPWPRR